MNDVSVNQQIAELLGWTDVQMRSTWRDGEEGHESFEALYGTDANGLERWVPDYEHSLDAVAAALRGTPTKLELYFETGCAELTERRKGNDRFVSRWTEDGTLELHAALCLLAWATAQKGATP